MEIHLINVGFPFKGVTFTQFSELLCLKNNQLKRILLT